MSSFTAHARSPSSWFYFRQLMCSSWQEWVFFRVSNDSRQDAICYTHPFFCPRVAACDSRNKISHRLWPITSANMPILAFILHYFYKNCKTRGLHIFSTQWCTVTEKPKPSSLCEYWTAGADDFWMQHWQQIRALLSFSQPTVCLF